MAQTKQSKFKTDIFKREGIGNSLLGGGDNSLLIDVRGEKGSYDIVAKYADSENVVGKILVEEWVLVSFSLKVETREQKIEVATGLLRAICGVADDYNRSLLCPLEGLADENSKKVLDQFGFRTAVYGILRRNAGAALPYSANI
jgi:hypothetical protein